MCDCGQRASLLESALSLLTTLLSDETDDTYLIALRLVVSLLEGELASVGFNCSHCGEVSRSSITVLLFISFLQLAW